MHLPHYRSLRSLCSRRRRAGDGRHGADVHARAARQPGASQLADNHRTYDAQPIRRWTGSIDNIKSLRLAYAGRDRRTSSTRI